MTLRFTRGIGAKAIKALAVATVLVMGSATFAAPAAAAPDSAIVIDAKTGKVLYAQDADGKRHPASLTKMMTLYMLFDAIDSGKTSLNDRITFSKHAAGQAPSKLGLKPGQTISVRDAILALVTKSANDVAAAVAEHLGGTESGFCRMMTERAHQLGMSKTNFVNASGLPASAQMTSARDMATLARALQEHHGKYFSYFSTRSFVWKGKRMGNHNRLLGKVPGVNGIKTGYTRASGFNLVTSVSRSNRKIVAVVIGGETSRWRDNRMAELIKTYLPKASAGATTVAMVPGKLGGRAVAQVRAKDMPVPMLRPAVDVVATASLAPSVSDAPPIVGAVAARIPAPDAPVARAPAAEVGTVASLIGANSVFALAGEEAIDQGDTSVDDDTVDAEQMPGTIVSGWKIQLAATPTKDAAEEILDSALSKANSVLGDATPYTEPVETRGATLYRARFAGFAGKNEARAACAYLSKQKFDCLALAQ